MIKELYVDNYRNLVNFKLPLRDLTLLLGSNGAGKTAVLDVLFALQKLVKGEAKIGDKHEDRKEDVFPSHTLTRWQSRNIQVIQLDIELDSADFQYRLEIEHERSTQRARISLEQLQSAGKPLFIFKGGEVTLYRDNHSQGPSYGADWGESALARVPERHDNTKLTRFQRFMRSIIVCGLYPSNFSAESLREEPSLKRDGGNFAAWYRHVLLEHPELTAEFSKDIGDAIDGCRGIRMAQAGPEARTMMVAFEQAGAKYELRFDEISDGQRAIIALYCLVRFAGSQGGVLMLDEPENYIALPEIQPWLVKLADACGAEIPQAVLCSHHPELIDYLGNDCGLLLQRESSGATSVRKPEVFADVPGSKLSEIIARGWEQ